MDGLIVAQRFNKLKLVDKDEVERMAQSSESDLDSYLNELGASWPDCSFVAPDGRKFAYLFGPRSIMLRMLARAIELTKPDKSQLKKIAGVIVEVGSDEPPMKFANLRDCDRTYLALHHSFDVPLSIEECEIIEATNETIQQQGDESGYVN